MEKDKFYFSYSIIGLIIGRMAIRSNLSFDGGLKFVVNGRNLCKITQNDDEFIYKHTYGKIRLTHDPISTCNFLGLSYERWLQGFDTVTDLYDWLLECNLFKKSHFIITNQDNNRVKDRSQGFVAYSINYPDKIEYDVMTQVTLKYAIMDKIIDIIDRERRKNNIKEKYSAHMIMDKGIQGNDIGRCIGFLKSKFDDFDEWIYQNNKEKVKQVIN
jgi:hypothetical protein